MAKRRGAGDGGIRKTADGTRWEGTISLGYANGKRRRKSVYGKTRAECAEKLRVAQQNVENGYEIDARLTVEEFLVIWQRDYLPATLKPNTRLAYAAGVKYYVNPHIGSIRLSRLRAADIDAMLQAIRARGLSQRSGKIAHWIMQNSLRHAVRRKLVVENVADSVDAPKGAQNRARDALTETEAEAILGTAHRPQFRRFEAFAVLALVLGLRRGELLGLRWQDADFEKRELSITHTLSYLPGQGLELDSVKTLGSRRVVPLEGGTAEALQAHKIEQEKDREKAGKAWRSDGFIFATHFGGPISPRNMARWWEKLTTAAVGRPIRIHAARHTAATLMLKRGVPLEVVSAILGHAGLAITMDIYGHIGMDAKRAALSLAPVTPIEPSSRLPELRDSAAQAG